MSTIDPQDGIDSDTLVRLQINLMREHDWLTCIEFGRVDDGQASDRWGTVEGWDSRIGLIHDRALGDKEARLVGFRIQDYSEYLADLDPDDGAWGDVWFHVPQLGLERASVAEIAVAVNQLFPNGSTPNRFFFNEAAGMNDNNKAIDYWLSCLATGDSMAHFGVGCCLYELDRYHDAYRHLRYYATIAPADPWNLRWYGVSAEAIGEFDEAIRAYDRAIELELEGEGDTDSAECRERLIERLEAERKEG